MYWNSTRMFYSLILTMHQELYCQIVLGNKLEDLQDAVYSLYDCFHSHLTAQEKATEFFWKSTWNIVNH